MTVWDRKEEVDDDDVDVDDNDDNEYEFPKYYQGRLISPFIH